ncbi:MAG: methyltransferase domain-containing protein [Acidimicrobiia bacterium]|nr:methyltransferase domain-containing protein [Acidimicrobiia bacterium]
MTPTERHNRATRRQAFGAAVEEYDKARPSYPGEAVDWSLGQPTDQLKVVEVGAGTGKLTRVLLDLGHDVIAVEPDGTMLERLRNNLGHHPQLDTHLGTAEDLPVPDGTADAVIAGQAFHWFEPGLALPEMERVLVDDGTAAAIWNTRDDSERWVAEMGRILGESTSGGATGRNVVDEVAFGSGFTAVESAQFRHTQHLNRHAVHALALSRSYTIGMRESEKEAMLTALDDLLRPNFTTDDEIRLPYIVECFRALRLSRP